MSFILEILTQILAEVGISSSMEEEILTIIKGSTTPPETKEEEILTRIKGSTTPPEKKNKDLTSEDSYASDGEYLFEQEIKEDEEELQHYLSEGNHTYESLIEQWFQVSTQLD